MDVYQDDIITQEDPKPKPAPLPEQHRAKLDSIVQKMISNKEPDENIRAVVDDFKQKYGQIVPQQSSPKAPVEPPSFEIKQPTYQVQLSQPTFRAIPATTVVTPSAPNEPINIEKQKDQFIPDERALKLQQKQGEARVKQDRINKELQGNDDIYEKKLREYRKDNYTIDNLRNDYKQKGQILSPQDEQTFLQREKQNQYNRPVTPEDITDFKTSTILRPNLSRKLIKDLNNPDVTHDAYKVDKYNEIASDPDPLNYMRFDKVDENAKNIKKGFLVYDPVSKQLVKPLGIIGSAIEGTMNKFKQDDKYNFYKNAPDHAIIDDLENERNKPNTDDPIPVPKGKVAEFIKEGSQMPLSPLLAGAIGSLAGPQAGTAAATAVGAYENRKAQFAATLPQVYNELRNQGVEKGEAFRRAKTQAENAQEIGTLVGAGQGLIGAEISKIPFGSAYNKAIGNVMKQNGNNIGKLFQEGLAQGAIGSTGEVLKNALAKSAGINRPVDEGALENFVYNAGMAVGIGAAIKAGKGLSKIDYKNILHGISKQPEENINAALQEKVQNGEITQTAADETQQRINEYKGLDKLIPDNVSDEARFKIQDKIKKRQEYEAQLETHDKAYHPEIKEKIKALDEEIVNLTKEGKEKQIKPESGLPKDKEKEATELAEEWMHEGILPDTYGSMVKQDPIGFWKMIAQQSQNRDENWRPLSQPIDEQAVRDQFGDTVVDYAKELFPAPEAPKSNISVIQPGEIKHPETTTISPKQEIKPASENIIPNKEFQTMGMGKDEGQPETKEARNLMKQRMLQGDIPIDGEGGTGETGRGFAARVLSAWENLKRTGDNNTSLITHSSVLKAIKTWENPGTWKGVEKPTDPTQMNNEQWLKFADEYNKESTNNGDLETFKGDKGDIHVIRHGQTEDNKMNKFRSGNTNLTEEGIAQAHDVGKRLQEKTGGNVPQIITSDLPRAVHTSDIIQENLKPTENAKDVRGYQGQLPESGEIGGGSQEVSGHDIQQVPTEPSISGETKQQAGRGTEAEDKGTGKEKVEPEYGDLPFKAEEGDDIITSIKNATTREKIEQYGLTPALQEVKRTHAEVWQNALNRIAKGFDTQSLVDQLKKKPRPLTDEEDALLLIHQIQKEAAYDAANKEINEAAETGDYGTWEEAHLRRTALRDDLQDIYDIGKKVGTLNARGLSARQMIADRRYSLVNMEEEYRAAQRGEALTADQKADIERIHGEIRKAKDAYEARIKQLEGENEKLRQQAIEKKIQREVKKEKIQKNIEKIKKDLSDNLDELRKIARNQGLGANPIALDAIPVIAKATKNLAKLGFVKIEQMAVHLYDALKDDYGKDKDGNYNLTVDHVMEAIEAANNQQRLDAYKKRIGQNIDELTGKLNQENVPNKPAKSPIILDDQAIKLKAQEERLKAQYEEKVKKAELKNRTSFQKVQDTFVKWQRAFKLSHVTTLGKLSGAGLTRLLSTPIEEGVGGAVSAVLPKLAQRAEGEGGLNIKAEAQAITSAFTKGMKDAAQTLKLGTKGGKGKSDLDIVFGKKDALPPEAIDFFGQLHSALKAPVKRAAFERSFAKRVARNIKNGVDVSDPLVQARIATEAYKDGQRAIFMQDNFVSDSYRNWVNSLEHSQKYPTAGKIAATTFQWMVPFVKVPTNIVGEVGSHVAGIPIGAAKLIHASFTKGLENLAPEEADMIMRNLKKGSVGAAALLMGYFNPTNFGGYYQKGEKRSDSDVGVGEAKVFGMTIPKWLLHAPIYETMQLGATIRRVKDKMVKGEPQGLGEGVWAGALGLAEEEPLIDQPMRIAKIFENKYQREKYFGELAKGTFDPGLLQDIAKWTDPQAKRKPEGIIESIEMGIPGLREEVGDGSANTGGGAGAGGTFEKPTRIKPEKPHKTHR